MIQNDSNDFISVTEKMHFGRTKAFAILLDRFFAWIGITFEETND